MTSGEIIVERGTHVITNDDREPLLYDAHDRPLYRQVGFHPPTPQEPDMAKKMKMKKKLSLPKDVGAARAAVADSMKGFKKPGKGSMKIPG